MSNFLPIEVVCRGSETQLQVAENLSKIERVSGSSPANDHANQWSW